MGDWLKLQSEMRDLEQELEIRTNDNAELYAKLCNALMQLDVANRIIDETYLFAQACDNKHLFMNIMNYNKRWRGK